MVAVVVFCGIGLAGLIAYIAIANAQKAKRGESDLLAHLHRAVCELAEFSPTQMVYSTISATGIAVDEQRKRICLVEILSVGEGTMPTRTARTRVIGYRDIVSAELVEDGHVDISSSRSIEGAVIGGLLAGEAGAIIGGLSRGRKQSKVVTTTDLRIIVNDVSSPCFTVRLFDFTNRQRIAWSNLPVNAQGQAKQWQALFAVIIRQAECQPDEPGSFRIVGVRKSDGLDVELILEAQSRANAKVKADLQGVIATDLQSLASFGTVAPAQVTAKSAVEPQDAEDHAQSAVSESDRPLEVSHSGINWRALVTFCVLVFVFIFFYNIGIGFFQAVQTPRNNTFISVGEATPAFQPVPNSRGLTSFDRKPRFSYAQYSRISEGMDYFDAWQIMGSPGEEIASDYFRGRSRCNAKRFDEIVSMGQPRWVKYVDYDPKWQSDF